MLGDKLEAQRAYEIGLANEVVPDEELADRSRRSPSGWPTRPRVRLLDDQGDAHPRARHRTSAAAIETRGGDPGAADDSRGLHRVLRRLARAVANQTGGADEPHRQPARAAQRRSGFSHALRGRQHRSTSPDRSARATRSPSSSTAPPATWSRRFGRPAVMPDDLVSLQVFVTDVAAYRGRVVRARAGLAQALRPPLSGDGLVRRDRAVRSRAQVELMGVAVAIQTRDGELYDRDPRGSRRPPSCGRSPSAGRPAASTAPLMPGAGRARAAAAAVPRWSADRPVR